MRALGLFALMALSTAATAQTAIAVNRFRSVELHHGGTVIVRHGPVQRVTMLKGDHRYTTVRVASGDRLVVANDRESCPRGYRVEVEVVTPQLDAVSVSNGGTLQIAGGFPPQASIAAAVEQGGTIDIRSIAADDVAASVYSGGGILTNAREALAATVRSGGAITYWGDPRIAKNVRDGGVVQRGKAADARRPLSEMNPRPPAIAPLAPIPPVPPTPR